MSENVEVGALYGPPLCWGSATLKIISALVPGIDWLPRPVPPIVPTTFSPTWKTPDVISISINFGTQYLVTSLPSKNAYIWVSGLILLATNCIFLDLMKRIISLLIVLSPKDSWSNCSTTAVLVPVLFSVPDLTVSLTVCLVSVKTLVPLWPPLWVWTQTLVLVSLLCLVDSPPQLVCHAFHTVPANPFCGSTPSLAEASARIAEKLPSLSIILASRRTVSTQLSVAGVNSTVPSQKLIINGVTLSLLVPKACFKYSISE